MLNARSFAGRKTNRAFISQECGSAERVVSFLNDVEVYRGFGLSANCETEVSHLAPLCKGSCHSAVQHFRYCCEYQVKDVQNSTEFSVTVTEGLLAEVMAKAERLVAAIPQS